MTKPLTSTVPLRRSAPKRRASRTGPDATTIAQVFARDLYRCVRCESDRDLVPHHRCNRGSGGSTVEWINSPTNLLTMCAVCNGLMESDQAVGREARAACWKVGRGLTLPSEIPVLYPGGRWFRLTEAGTRVRVWEKSS